MIQILLHLAIFCVMAKGSKEQRLISEKNAQLQLLRAIFSYKPYCANMMMFFFKEKEYSAQNIFVPRTVVMRSAGD